MDTQSETPATAAGAARRADRALAAAIDRPRPAGDGPGARYLDDLRHRPQLPREEEDALVAAAQERDAAGQERLVETFLPLIASVANEYRGSPGVDEVELIQEGVVGLLRAAASYDAARGTPFWAYARPWVRRAMRRRVAELRNPVVLSERDLRRLSRMRTAHDELAREQRREPSREDIERRALAKLAAAAGGEQAA
jgi:RNA polymerase sigma factor (sigma-70 family)